MWHDKNGGYEERLYGEKPITDDKWHHVVEVYDGKSIKLYIDGKLDGQEEPSGELPVNEEPLWIGARPGNVAATGIIDEVRFFLRPGTFRRTNKSPIQGPDVTNSGDILQECPFDGVLPGKNRRKATFFVAVRRSRRYNTPTVLACKVYSYVSYNKLNSAEHCFR